MRPIKFLFDLVSSLSALCIYAVENMVPVIIESMVVFPAPLCPNNTVMCPLYIFIETLLTAITD